MLIAALLAALVTCGQYDPGFKVSIYTMVYEVEKMANVTWLQQQWQLITDQVHVDKIYLETHRDGHQLDEKIIPGVKQFFTDRGVEISGGITFTLASKDPGIFASFCWSDPVDRQIALNLSRLTARNYDQFILDDFFFTNCKSDIEIAAKGSKSWTQYRLDNLHEAGKTLIVDPAHAINPNTKVTVKYPNWYDHFPGLGFDLLEGPKIFDRIWTGGETRFSDDAQHLQPYLGYLDYIYFSNIAPGRNNGSWIDPYGQHQTERGTGGITFERYAEQLWLPLFAKAGEVALFNFNDLITVKASSTEHHVPWENSGSSFNYSDAFKPYVVNGRTVIPSTVARAAGYAFEKVAKVYGKLGKPKGIPSYKPYNSRGDDYLQTFLGMIGIPVNLVPEYPADAKVVIITAQAADDPQIIEKIQKTLKAGGDVIVTTGFVEKIPEKLQHIAEVKVGKEVIVTNFAGNVTTEEILVKQTWYQTNDCWEIQAAGHPLVTGTFGIPIILRALYSIGNLYVFAVPEDPGQLYKYPPVVLDALREITGKEAGLYFKGQSRICLYAYDNGAFIVHNFNDVAVNITVVFTVTPKSLVELPANTALPLASTVGIQLQPHQFRVFLKT